MIQYIKLSNHKALQSASLSDLGHINIICGKNNSGKTTILEALAEDKYYNIGKRFEHNKELLDAFSRKANQYNKPPAFQLNEWFSTFISDLINKKVVWYVKDSEQINKSIIESLKQDTNLRHYEPNFIDCSFFVNHYFSPDVDFFNPILIPPKRKLEFSAVIQLNDEVMPLGNGIINKLFFLKNQDPESENYKTFRNIYDIFSEITNSKFNIIPNVHNQILLLFKTDNDWIEASDCGLGLSDVLVIVTILNLLKNNVFLIEEPENHLHAEYQKRLLKYISGIENKQFFISTHSPVFLDSGIADKIFYCVNDGKIQVSDQTSKAEIIKSLGYSVAENLVADVIIFTEGPTDIPVLTGMLNWLGVESNHVIKFWPLGGDIMQSLDLSVFSERKNVFALIDSDPGSKVIRTRFMRKCEEMGIYCKKLNRYAIENYFSLQAIKEVYGDELPEGLTEIKPKESVDKQIGFKDKGKSIKVKNSQIVKSMSLSDIDGTDLHEFLLTIKNFLEN